MYIEIYSLSGVGFYAKFMLLKIAHIYKNIFIKS